MGVISRYTGSGAALIKYKQEGLYMKDKEKIKMLELEIELLKEIMELKEKLNSIPPYPIYPTYPQPEYPWNPMRWGPTTGRDSADSAFWGKLWKS